MHDPEHLRGLAEHLRKEADRCEVVALELESGEMAASCVPGCWWVYSTCIAINGI